MNPYQHVPYNQYQLDYYHHYRQQNEVSRIYQAFRQEHPELINELGTLGMDEQLITYISRAVIQYSLAHANQFSGTINNRTTNIYESMLRQLPWLIYLLQAYHLSGNQMRRILRTMIRFTLQQIRNSYY